MNKKKLISIIIIGFVAIAMVTSSILLISAYRNYSDAAANYRELSSASNSSSDRNEDTESEIKTDAASISQETQSETPEEKENRLEKEQELIAELEEAIKQTEESESTESSRIAALNSCYFAIGLKKGVTVSNELSELMDKNLKVYLDATNKKYDECPEKVSAVGIVLEELVEMAPCFDNSKSVKKEYYESLDEKYIPLFLMIVEENIKYLSKDYSQSDLLSYYTDLSDSYANNEYIINSINALYNHYKG